MRNWVALSCLIDRAKKHRKRVNNNARFRKFPARLDNPKLKKCVRGIVQPRRVEVTQYFRFYPHLTIVERAIEEVKHDHT